MREITGVHFEKALAQGTSEEIHCTSKGFRLKYFLIILINRLWSVDVPNYEYIKYLIKKIGDHVLLMLMFQDVKAHINPNYG
jgi:hypothetical protein